MKGPAFGPMRNRIFYKIFGSYLLIVVLTASVFGMLIAGKIRQDVTSRIEQDLLSHARLIALMPIEGIPENILRLAGQTKSRITFINPAGRVVADSERDAAATDNHLNRPEIQEARISGRGKAVRYSRTVGVDMLYVALPVGSGPSLKGYIRLALPLFEVKHATDRLFQSLYQTAAVIIIPILLIAFLYARRIAAPIRRMEDFARRVSEGDLSGTLMISSSDEIGQLAKSINRMVLELQEKIHAAGEESRKLEAAFSSMMEGVLILDGRNQVELINRGMMNILGERFKVVSGKTTLEAFRNAALQEALDAVRETARPLRQEITLVSEPPIILEASLSPMQAPPGGEKKIMMVFHDVTRLKQLERMRADFVANVTHEIKTPLTAIAGFIETLLEGALDDRETALRFLKTVEDNTQRLSRLVDDLLTLSGIELGEMKIHLENVYIKDIMKDAIAMLEPKACEKKIEIQSELPADMPLIRADRDKAVQILLNVLDNAVKFTPEAGTVYITASSSEKEGCIVIKIADTGIGIPKNELPRLGERFYRVDKTRSRQLGGTGLGLSIVKHLLKAQGGWMEIYSTPGKGTTVCLYFPAADKLCSVENS